jgi:hypothetical protein
LQLRQPGLLPLLQLLLPGLLCPLALQQALGSLRLLPLRRQHRLPGRPLLLLQIAVAR